MFGFRSNSLMNGKWEIGGMIGNVQLAYSHLKKREIKVDPERPRCSR